MDFKKLLDEATEKRNAILNKLAPLREEEAKLQKQFAVIDTNLRIVRQQIADIEKEEGLAEISRDIVALSQAIYKKAG